MRPRILSLVLCGLSLLLGAIGCRVSGTSFQMDSDQRSPSLGLQLSPRKKRTPKDDWTIRQTGGVENRSVKTQPPADKAVPQRSAWSRLLGRFGTPKRVPLPRTDIRSDEDAPDDSRYQAPRADDF